MKELFDKAHKAVPAMVRPKRGKRNYSPFYYCGVCGRAMSQSKRVKGDILLWKEDPSIKVVVNSERRVLYQGEEVSISALSAKLKGYNTKHIAPGKYWLYNEKLLDEIYDETYPFEE